jgi:hypothetical protein
MRASIAIAFGAVWSLMLAMGAGCARNPVPPVLAAPQSCSGNPCAALNCPSAYTCRVDNHCVARCEAERVGNKPF